MSRLSRGVFDKLRRWGLPSATLPYDSGEWWDSSYGRNDGHPIEWGGVGFADLAAHEWASWPGGRWADASARRAARLADDDLAGAARRSGGSLLVLGGGTSRLSQDLYDAGWPKVLDCDISPEAVKQAQARIAALAESGRAEASLAATAGSDAVSCDAASGDEDWERRGLGFIVADARTMRPERDLGGQRFDVCVDKGLVDALWCAGAAAAPLSIPKVSASVAAALRPSSRTKPSGSSSSGSSSADSSSSGGGGGSSSSSPSGSRFLVLSYSGPDDMIPLLGGDQSRGGGDPDASPVARQLGRLWASVEARQLRQLWLYVLTRSAAPFRELSSVDFQNATTTTRTKGGEIGGGNGEGAAAAMAAKEEARVQAGKAMRQRRNRSRGKNKKRP